MNEGEMVRLPEQEVRKIERINESFANRAEAEAAKEAQQKMRILFERTAQEALPFVVYVIYMGAMGLIVVFKLLDFDGAKLWLGAVLLSMVMLLPLLLLPRASFWWLKRRFQKIPGTEDSLPSAQEIGSSGDSD